ncbi:MAG: hypothetical protein NVS2B5_21620 [Beijerinckiaceae bacterium]
MSAARASLTDQTRMRLLDLWRGEDDFGRPLGCVTTSFTFDAELFEEQCLARFLSIQSNPNETAKAYLIEREEKLAQCFACVLVDRAHAAPDRSLRWHMLPITLPSRGVLHAKLTLLAWEKRVRLLIGSANLSEPAYRRNQEVMAALDFSEDENPAPDVLAQCVAFLQRVRSFAPGFASTEAGPQAALAGFLSSIEQRASSLPVAKKAEAECVLVPLVPEGDPVIDQLRALWLGPRPDRAWALSPFFDEDQKASATAAAFASLRPMARGVSASQRQVASCRTEPCRSTRLRRSRQLPIRRLSIRSPSSGSGSTSKEGRNSGPFTLSRSGSSAKGERFTCWVRAISPPPGLACTRGTTSN